MYNVLVQAHSGWRYLVLLVLVVAIVKYLIGMLGNGKWSNLDTTINRFTPIVFDIQFLLGAILWITGSWWASETRVGAWEHPILAALAVIAAHLVSMRVKSATTDKSRFQVAAIGYLIVAVVIAFAVSLMVGWNLFA